MTSWLIVPLVFFCIYVAGVLFMLAVDAIERLLGYPQEMTGKARVKMALAWPLVVIFGE